MIARRPCSAWDVWLMFFVILLGSQHTISAVAQKAANVQRRADDFIIDGTGIRPHYPQNYKNEQTHGSVESLIRSEYELGSENTHEISFLEVGSEQPFASRQSYGIVGMSKSNQQQLRCSCSFIPIDNTGSPELSSVARKALNEAQQASALRRIQTTAAVNRINETKSTNVSRLLRPTTAVPS
eukprot:jgi/Bigna1/126954/aug1.3_g1662